MPWDSPLLSKFTPLSQKLRERATLSKNTAHRLVGREGFRLRIGNFNAAAEFGKSSLPDVAKLRRILHSAAEDEWAGFQIYYPMTAAEVAAATGLDLVEAMLAVFEEVTPAMNQCMQVNISHNS